jgi:predicted lipoprotein
MDNKTLRDRIYGWPLLATCSLDRDTASRFADPSSYDIAAKLVNARSLAAIEYLIYVDSPDHTCLQTPAGWDALGANLPRARCRLAEAIAIDVAAQAELLETAWRADGGNFVGELSTAGTSSSSIPSAQEGINRISDAMFYTDKMIKDMKLGETSGITINVCGTVGEPCLREVEHPISDRATFAIRANLVALREAFTGTAAVDGPGFDDFLIGVGHPEVAQSMTADLDAAIADANALPDSFLTALSTDYQQIVTTHAAVKQLTDDLKTQFLTLLNLEIPNDVATDND